MNKLQLLDWFTLDSSSWLEYCDQQQRFSYDQSQALRCPKKNAVN